MIILSILLPLLAGCSTPAPPPENDSKPGTNALQKYLENGDQSFGWKVEHSFEKDGLAIDDILLTSQQWKDNRWKHQLTVITPQEVGFNSALLFITGGSLIDGEPKPAGPDDELLKAMAEIAVKNRSVTAVLRQVPNQPLFEDLYEDALISFTLQKYRETEDESWPLLLPMVKSAVRAMDAVQEYCREEKQLDIGGFTISGASKRGWTTWLAGASDSRVEAICPMVIDLLNLPVQMDYQVKAWGDYSPAIEDYVALGIAQDASTPDGQELAEIIDPFSYRDSLRMPKLIFLGTNDEYWPVDAVKHYIDGIPGKNWLHYVPNAPHDLNGGQAAISSLSGFFGLILADQTPPSLSWSHSVRDGKFEIAINSGPGPEPLKANLWTAASEDRDFRDASWIDTGLSFQDRAQIKASISLPLKGFRALYLNLSYPAPNGTEYSVSSRVFVLDPDGII